MLTNKQRALAIRAYKTTAATCAEYAKAAREAGDEETAATFERMAAKARRQAITISG